MQRPPPAAAAAEVSSSSSSTPLPPPPPPPHPPPHRPATREGPEPPADKPPPPPRLLTQSHSTSSITTTAVSQAPGGAAGGGTDGNHPPPTPAKDRRPIFSRKAASFSSSSGSRRRGSSVSGSTAVPGASAVTDAAAPPALPDYALGAAAKVASRERDSEAADARRSPASPESFSRMLSRSGTAPTSHMPPPPTPVGLGGGSGGNGGGSSFWQPSDANIVHQQITELANKRIATLNYLRRAHGGRVYWFNAYLLDKSDLGRMPCFDPRRLSRKATNYLLLGLSLPVLIDLYSSTPLEFLRGLGTLLSEFDSFQQLRSESSASLTRARLPNMFRRPGAKGRRSTSAADATADEAAAAAAAAASASASATPGGGATGGLSPSASTPSVMNFAASESDLLPGEEYTHLLTPSLPFDPDYFETFETLCDTLIDCYAKFLALVPTARECSAPVAELFTKADARVRKIIVQGIVKEFEDSSRANIKSEVASVGKVVLGGLM